MDVKRVHPENGDTTGKEIGVVSDLHTKGGAADERVGGCLHPEGLPHHSTF